MKLNYRQLLKKFQGDGLNISIQRWIIKQYNNWLSEEESKFITLLNNILIMASMNTKIQKDLIYHTHKMFCIFATLLEINNLIKFKHQVSTKATGKIFIKKLKNMCLVVHTDTFQFLINFSLNSCPEYFSELFPEELYRIFQSLQAIHSGLGIQRD